MDGLILHSSTEHELKAFVRRPTHALLVIGNEGTGKRTLLERLARETLHIKDAAVFERYLHVRTVEPTGNSISIDAVRDLQQFTKLQIARDKSEIQRVIIINNANAMTIEAQNALLKLLEEPPANTVFLLSSANAQGLLATVRSRTRQLVIKQPVRPELESFFADQGFSASKIQNAYLMSGGLPGLMHALLHEEADHPLTQAVSQARSLLQSTTFERLCGADNLAKQKDGCLKLLFVLQQMAHAALARAAETGGSERTFKQWQRVLGAAYNAENQLAASAQPKIVVTNLMLAL